MPSAPGKIVPIVQPIAGELEATKAHGETKGKPAISPYFTIIYIYIIRIHTYRYRYNIHIDIDMWNIYIYMFYSMDGL